MLETFFCILMIIGVVFFAMICIAIANDSGDGRGRDF